MRCTIVDGELHYIIQDEPKPCPMDGYCNCGQAHFKTSYVNLDEVGGKGWEMVGFDFDSGLAVFKRQVVIEAIDGNANTE